MSNFDVKLQINVLNQLRILRNSTFKDPLSFLDEIIQNAQRAKSKNVYVQFNGYDNQLTIENDGQVLNDPQKLFSMSESDWDEDVKKNENPFGVGFFSVITVSNYIEIFSGNKHIIFDVSKILETGNTDIFTEEVESFYDGFKLILHNFHLDKIYSSDVAERVQLLGKYIHELNIHFNGELQEKKNLTDSDGSTFHTVIEEDALFTGWLAFQPGWSYEGINIFYKGRPVSKLDAHLPYLKGDLHVTDRALNLRAPDRKDIIQDEKYYSLIETIQLYAQILAETAILNGKQQDIDKYASALAYYGNKEELKRKMTFTIFSGKRKEDMSYLRGMALAVKKIDKEKVSSLSEYEVYLRKQEFKVDEKQEIILTETIEQKAPAARGVIEHDSYHSGGTYNAGYTEKPEIAEEDTELRAGEFVIVESEPTFWMKFDDIEKYEYNFNIIKHYSLKLIIARNNFEIEVLKTMTDLNVLYIEELKEDIEMEISLSNLSLTPQERRASMLLDMVSRMAGLTENAFTIGDLIVQKKTTIESLNKSFSTIEDSITAFYNKSDNSVFVDRSVISKSMLSESEEETLELADYKFLLANLPNLIEQLKLLDIKDKATLYNRTLMALAVA